MPSSPQERRAAALRALADERFDLLVVGGGATGCGVARDAALRGLKVALVEREDIASGTSSRSSKLIHGGLRYLQQGDLRLVFEGTNERALLRQLAPHLVRPLEFLAPQYSGDHPGLVLTDLGLWVYDAMAKFSGPKLHRTHRAAKIRRLEPQLRTDGLRGGLVYYDCVTDDARLTLETALDAQALGATVLTYAQAEGLLRGPGERVAGLRVRDRLGGADVEVRARVVLCALGPFTDAALAALGAGAPRPLLRPTKGVHLVFPEDRLRVQHAVLMRAPRDGRVVFLIPWHDTGRTVLGTTDTDYDGDFEHPYADAADAEYLLACLEHYLPGARLAAEDATASWAGLRPLIAPRSLIARSYDVSREHEVFERAPGLLAVAGGKLTTYRRMARDAVDRALPLLGSDPVARPCQTHERPLPGAQTAGEGPAEESRLDELRAALARELPEDVARHLVHAYGVCAPRVLQEAGSLGRERIVADLPYVWAEIDRAVQHELAETLCDVIARRAPLLLNGRDRGLGVCEAVAARIAGPLGWSGERLRAEVAAYRAAAAEALRFRG